MKFLLIGELAFSELELDPDELDELDDKYPNDVFDLDDNDPLVINYKSACLLSQVADDAHRRACDAIDLELRARKTKNAS